MNKSILARNNFKQLLGLYAVSIDNMYYCIEYTFKDGSKVVYDKRAYMYIAKA